MRDLAGELAQANAERSLFLTYAASPLLFESLLLPSLQRRGAAEITLLVDRRAFASSVAEAAWTRGVGVSYGYHPVHLRKRFHPKLYLTLNSQGASLLVASANLTPSSLHENAEVLDRLFLSWDGEGDAAAFLDYADLLEALLEIAQMPDDARLPVRRVREELSTSALGATGSSPARLLHTGTQALLPQIVDHVRGHHVEEIVAVSPFFDDGCKALLALAGAFPAAAIQLVTRSDPTNLDPRLLAPLGDRLQVRSYGGESDPRRLHGKALWLRAGDRAWALVGSANLTWPAWMASAKTGGNFEAMVLRPDDSGAIYETLFRPPSELLPLDRLQHRAEPDEEDPRASGLRIRSATLTGGSLVVIAAADAKWSGARVQMEIELQGEAHSPAATVEWSGREFQLRAPFVLPTDAFEAPVLIRLGLVSESEEQITGYTWLHRPDALSRSARERRWRQAVAIVEHNGWGYGGEEYAAVVDLWCDLVRIASGTVVRVGDPGARTKTDEVEDVSETVLPHPVARLVVPVGELPRPGRADGTAAQGLLGHLARTLGRLLGDYDFERRFEGRTFGDAEDTELGEGDGDALSVWQPSAAERRLAEAADRELFAAIPTLFAAPVDVEQVPGVALSLEVLLRLVLQRCARLSATSGAAEQPVIRQIRETLRLSLSMEGALRGTPEGWFLRGWNDESWRRVVREQFAEPDRIASMLASVGLSAASGPDGRETHGLLDIMAGFEVICRGSPAELPAVTESLFAQLQNITTRGKGLPDPARIIELVRSASRAEIPVLALLSTLEPILLAERGEEVPDELLPERYCQLPSRADTPRLIGLSRITRRSRRACCTRLPKLSPCAISRFRSRSTLP